MYAQVEKPKDNKSRTVANSVAQKKTSKENGNQFNDGRKEAVIQNSLKDLIQRGKSKGSHNKKLIFKVKSYVTMNTTTNVQTTHTVNGEFNLGILKGHPSGYSDWDAYATAKVNEEYDIGQEVLVSVDYKKFTQK